MSRIETAIPDVCILEPQLYGDARGWLFESYHLAKFHDLGIDTQFVQENHSRSGRGVLRGLHYQWPFPQGKLVRVLSGSVLDVAVDLRRSSPTFRKSVAVVLSSENHRTLWVPRGFAHGFYVLSEVAEMHYQCDDYYSPKSERGIAWNDPALAIPWGIANPSLSARDAAFHELVNVAWEDLPE